MRRIRLTSAGDFNAAGHSHQCAAQHASTKWAIPNAFGSNSWNSGQLTCQIRS